MAVFFGALNLAIYLRYSANLPFAKGGPAPWQDIFIAYPFVALIWIIAGAFVGSYRIFQSPIEEISAVFKATLLTFLAVLSATFFYRGFSYSRGMIVFFIPLVLILVSIERLCFRVIRHRVLIRFGGQSRVAILGRSKTDAALITALLEDKEYYRVVGRIELSVNKQENKNDSKQGTSITTSDNDLTTIGFSDELEQLCASGSFDSLIIVEHQPSENIILESIEACLGHQIAWSMIPSVHELLIDRARITLIDGIPLIGMRGTNIVGFNWAAKRIIDIVVSLIILLLSSPLLIAVAIAIRLSSPGPILYVQQRVGYRGRLFSFYKFRSMHIGNDDKIHREYTRKWITENKAHSNQRGNQTFKIVNDPRIFWVGKFIRKFSIDELPQLINVLRGEMSIIGPRPALPYEVEVYRQWHRRRFEAPPGITGLWQVSGRNRLSFEEMVKLDIEYLENWSLLLDIQILLRTARVILIDKAY
ncbi:MAG: sugar transferase [Deltaproteobacteria bacterium]|nr:sugar transferase [Deltaproteobacteria bacterium]